MACGMVDIVFHLHIFFFQAEDGIRLYEVTGVQTCALPIYLRLGAFLLLGATAWFSYEIVNQSTHRMLTHFAFELSQNLYFVGLVLTYVLWGAIFKLRESRTRLIQLVLALGIYFSAFAANYALRNLYPNLQPVWHFVTPLLGCILPATWMFAF